MNNKKNQQNLGLKCGPDGLGKKGIVRSRTWAQRILVEISSRVSKGWRDGGKREDKHEIGTGVEGILSSR